MSPKLISFTLVIAAGLIYASATDSHKDDTVLNWSSFKGSDITVKVLKYEGSRLKADTFSPFTGIYEKAKNGFQTFILDTGKGAVENLSKITNDTAWATEDASAVTQSVTMENVKIAYERAKVSLGLLSNIGKVVFNLPNTEANITLTATEDSDGTCQLNVTATLTSLGVNLDLSNLGLLGRIIQGILPLVESVVNTALPVITKALPSVLELLVGEGLTKIVDLDDICKTILANGNPDIIPGFSSLVE